MKSIGTLSENSLHAALKRYLMLPGDKIEQPIESFVIDIVRENKLFEIQIKNFYSLKRKLNGLLDKYPIQIVYPIAQQKWIVRVDPERKLSKRRKSPKRGSIYDIFDQLVYITNYLPHDNLSVQALLVEQEDWMQNDGKGSWRRKGWSLVDQHLREIYTTIEFNNPQDYGNLLPKSLPSPFLNIELSSAANIPIRLSRKMTYTLAKIGVLYQDGKKGNANLYRKH